MILIPQLLWRVIQDKLDPRPRIIMGSKGPFVGGRDLGWFKYSLPLQELAGHHQYVVGRSGSGKSKFLLWYLYQLITHGQGALLLDPHTDLSHDILNLLASQTGEPDQSPWLADPDNARRLLYFEPGRSDRLIPMNLLLSSDPPYHIAQAVIEAFRRTWSGLAAAPQFETITLHSLLLLIEHRLSLCELPALLMKQTFRNRLLAGSQQPEIVSFFHERFGKWGREQATRIESTLNKASALLLNPQLKLILGANENRVDLRQIMDQRQVLIVNLGTCDRETRRLLGSLLTVRLEQAALSRADIPEQARISFFAVIDEFASFVQSEGSAQVLAEILSEVRKYKVFLTLAHQGIHQLESSTRLVGALDQTKIKIIFGSGAKTGRIIADDLFTADAQKLKQTDDPSLPAHLRAQFQSLAEQKELFVQAIKNQKQRELFLLPPNSNQVVSLRTVTVPRLALDPDDLERLKTWLLPQVAVPAVDLAEQLRQRQAAFNSTAPAVAGKTRDQLNRSYSSPDGFKPPKLKAVNLADLFGHSGPEEPTTQ
jgi:hypothetical protein